ncbi:MAG: beta-galactosidase [Bacteroidota bacterium]
MLLNFNVLEIANQKLLLQGQSNSATLKVFPEVLRFPSDWEKIEQLTVEIDNPGANKIEIELGVEGVRNFLSENRAIAANSKTKLALPLKDLPLTAGNKAPYRPKYIYITCKSPANNFTISLQEMVLVEDKLLKPRPVVDQFGQRINKSWQGKIMQESALIEGIATENVFLDSLSAIESRSNFGGFTNAQKYKATGFFRVEKLPGDRWVFIDPEGFPFWSLGVTGVRTVNDGPAMTPLKGRAFLFDSLPDINGSFSAAYTGDSLFSFYAWNVLRKYETLNDWREQNIRRLKRWGLNTVGNWSAERMLTNSKLPYTRALRSNTNEKYLIGARFSDVFHEGWETWLETHFAKISAYQDDKMLIGYFVDNEGSWREMDLLAHMPDTAATRKKWYGLLKDKYRSIKNLNGKWQTNFKNWEVVKLMKEGLPENQHFKADYTAFEKAFAEKYFSTIKKTIQKYDPNHLYLGCRFTKNPLPKHIMQAAGKYTDVTSVNVYDYAPIYEMMKTWYEGTGRPLLIGEHHVALKSDRQLPPKWKTFTQEERYTYYINYVKTWAEMPFSLGCHWYQFSDQHITGRVGNGENLQEGLVDITDQPHRDLVEAIHFSSKKLPYWTGLIKN